MAIQQPPPVCKKGPPKVPPTDKYPPPELEAAVTYKPTFGPYFGTSFQAIIHLTQGNPTPPYTGSKTSGEMEAIVRLLLFTEILVWEADIDFLWQGQVVCAAVFNVMPYQDDEPFVLALATVLAHPGGAVVTMKVMT